MAPPASGRRGRSTAGPSADSFASRLEHFADRIAVVTEDGRRLTYLELAAQADAFSARLPAGRVLVAIEAANELDPLIAYLGALRRGDPVLLLASGDHAQHAGILETYRPDVRFARRAGGWDLIVEGAGRHALHEDLAVLLSTSGSTGAAKLVKLAASAIDANARAIAEYLDIGPDDRAITTLPIHYCYGLSVINSHLSRGATVLLTDRSVIEPTFWDFFEREAATSFAGVPHTFELLDRIGFRDRPPPSLRTVTQAGGRLPVEAALRYGDWARRHGVRLFVMYGQTEATARMSFLPPEALLENLDSIGVPIPGGAFRLEDEDGRIIDAAGETGELIYSGPNVMMGYALTAADLATGAALAELRTGDLAQRDAKGFYRIVGRKSRFSKLFGLRLSLDEIEAGLSRRGLAAAVAGDDTLVAVALAAAAAPADLAEALGEQYGVPSSVFDIAAVEDHPRLASGKVDYHAILAAAKARRAEGPQGQEDGLAAAFRRSFPRARIGPADSFISLGGDSLSYVNLAMEIEAALGRLPERWEDMSVRQLQTLEGGRRAQGWWRMRSMETEVLIRALSIMAVVVTHSASNLIVAGGAEVLLMLSGYNLSRYQRGRLIDGKGATVLWSFLKRIIAPYYAILIAYFLWAREIDIPSLLLVSNFHGRFGSLLEPYWFLETLTQCLALVVALFMIKPVRALADRNPWALGLGGLAAALAVRVGLFAAFDHQHLLNRTPESVFYLFALGWCLHQAVTTARRVLLTAVVLALGALEVFGPPDLWMRFSYPSNWTHGLWLLGAGAGILWAPRIALPSALRTAATIVAAASFYIYLTHGVVLHLLVWVMGVHNPALALAAALGAGVATWFVMQRWLPEARADRAAGAGRLPPAGQTRMEAPNR